MDSQTIVKTLKGNRPQPPMFNATETLRQNNPTIKDITLPSYLKPKDRTPNLHESGVGFTTDDTEISIFDAQKYFSESNDSYNIKGEQPSHDLLSVPRPSSVSSGGGYGRIFRMRSFRGKPTASSEASWISQTGLLATPPGSTRVSLKNLRPDRRNKRWSAVKKWFFGRKCCCSGEKSVQVKDVTSVLEHREPVVLINAKKTYRERDQRYEETTPGIPSKECSIKDNIVEIHHIKAIAPSPLNLSSTDFSSMDAPRQQRISASGRSFIDGTVGFTFPILNASSNHASRPALKTIIGKPIISPLEDSSIHELQSLSRPSSMDNPVDAPIPFNPGSPIAHDDDVGSDASSDLFEIESFSTQTTSYPMYRRRDSADEDQTHNARRFASANEINNIQYGKRIEDEPPKPKPKPASDCCPPSEVGIDWTVATAEGRHRGRAAAEVGDFAALRPPQEEAGGGEGKSRSDDMMLMSCGQEKAVRVGPQAVKCVGPAIFPLHVGGRPPAG